MIEQCEREEEKAVEGEVTSSLTLIVMTTLQQQHNNNTRVRFHNFDSD